MLWTMFPTSLRMLSPISCSVDAVIRVYDEADNVIETHEHKGEFNFSASSVEHNLAAMNALNFSGFSCLTVRLLCD
jgi:hypothetical protein